MSLIRLVNLDMLWDKELSTVNSMLQVFTRATSAARHLGLTPSFLRSKQPWPLTHNVGFGEAMLLLWDSVQPRKQKDGATRQFDTIRKLRSMSRNIQSTSYLGKLEGLGVRDGGNSLALEHCATNSVLFTKFIQGCEKRMGRRVQQDTALSVHILIVILRQLQNELKSAEVSIQRKRDIVMLGSFLAIVSVTHYGEMRYSCWLRLQICASIMVMQNDGSGGI